MLKPGLDRRGRRSPAGPFLFLPALLVMVLLAGCPAGLGGEPRVPRGTLLGGVDVSGRTASEVRHLLAEMVPRLAESPVYLTDGVGARKAVSLRLLGAAPDERAILDDLFRGNRPAWVAGWGRGRRHQLPLRWRIEPRTARRYLESLAGEWNIPPRNASYDPWRGRLIAEEWGRQLVVEDSLRRLAAALATGGTGPVRLVLRPVAPRTRRSDLARVGRQLLSAYSTQYSMKDQNRASNIARAATTLNGVIIQPGELFSFNDVVGPRDSQHGYLPAPELINQKYVAGIGGGVCQVSSTLYNSVLLADLDVVERFNHSRPPAYVPLGRDATVAYGLIDFAFLNRTPFPVMIAAEAADGVLRVGILGRRTSPFTIKIITRDRVEIPPRTIRRADSDVPRDRIIEEQGGPGYRITVVRVLKLGETVVREELISKDTYPPVDRLVRVGSGTGEEYGNLLD